MTRIHAKIAEMNGRQLLQYLATRSRELASQRGEDVDRVRKKIAFDFVLRRLAAHATSSYVLKGGYAIELKFQKLRATKDLDLFTRTPFRDVFRNDIEAAAKKLRQHLVDHLALPASNYDHLVRFRVGDDTKILRGGGGGIQVTVRMMIESQRFTEFSIDLTVEDIRNPPHEAIKIAPVISELKMTLGEQEFEIPTNEMIWAEKLHCYMRHGDEFKSRVKDFVDLVVVGQHGVNPGKTKQLIRDVFSYWLEEESTQRLPGVPSIPTDGSDLKPPPAEWQPVYTRMAKELGVDIPFADAYFFVKETLQRILDS